MERLSERVEIRLSPMMKRDIERINRKRNKNGSAESLGETIRQAIMNYILAVKESQKEALNEL